MPVSFNSPQINACIVGNRSVSIFTSIDYRIELKEFYVFRESLRDRGDQLDIKRYISVHFIHSFIYLRCLTTFFSIYFSVNNYFFVCWYITCDAFYMTRRTKVQCIKPMTMPGECLMECKDLLNTHRLMRASWD